MEKELYVVPLRIRYREVSACVRLEGGGCFFLGGGEGGARDPH